MEEGESTSAGRRPVLDPDTPSRSGTTKEEGSTVAAQVATVVLALVAVATFVANIVAPTLSGSRPVADIVSPPGGAVVPYPVPVRGTVEGLPDDRQLWLWIKKTDERRIHPLDRACTVAGTSWTCDDVFLGDLDTGRGQTFEISVVDASAGAIAVLQEHGQRDKQLPDAYDGIHAPEGARVLDSVTVRRG